MYSTVFFVHIMQIRKYYFLGSKKGPEFVLPPKNNNYYFKYFLKISRPKMAL